MIWKGIKLYLGMLWCSPITFVGGIYAWLFTVFGWYQYVGWIGHAFFFKTNPEKMPKFLTNIWIKWNGHCMANVIVMREDPNSSKQFQRSSIHELAHADQCMRLGVFQPILYSLVWVANKIGCPRNDSYYDTIFEIDARRAAGQIIDIKGTMQKLKSNK